MQGIQAKIEEFFHAPSTRSAWLTCAAGEVYVRKGLRCINGEVVHTLDIANVQAAVRGQGFFKEVRKAAEALEVTVYVENVLEPRLIPHLLREGYTEVEGLAPSFFKHPQQPLDKCN